jgi:Ca2+-binding EF-hand superfamily protein
MSPDGEAYIDDGDLKELLIELLGDDISEEEIQKVLDAASDENLTEEEFDNLIDEFILKNKN